MITATSSKAKTDNGEPLQDVFSQAQALFKRGTAPPLAPASAGVRTETFTLDHGEVILRWPTAMTAEDLKDVEDWLEIVKRKLKRGAQDSKSADPAKPE